MSQLFGSAPSVTNQGPFSSVSPSQQSIQALIAQILQGNTGKGPTLTGGQGQFMFPGPFAAPVTGTQGSLIDQIIAQVTGQQPTPPPTAGPTVAPGATGTPSIFTPGLTGDMHAVIPSSLGNGAVAPSPPTGVPIGQGQPQPQRQNLTAGGNLGAASTALQQVLSGQPQDFSGYFNTNVAQPLEQTFEQQTLPAIKAAFSRSAGGTTSSGANTGYSAAIGQASQDLGRQLQQADTALGTQAITNAMNNQAKAIALAPGVAGQQVGELQSALSAATLPQVTEQTGIQGEQASFNTALQALLQLFNQSGNFSNANTQQTNTVVNPGTGGLLSSFLGSAGGSNLAASGLSSLFGGGGPGGGLFGGFGLGGLFGGAGAGGIGAAGSAGSAGEGVAAGGDAIASLFELAPLLAA